ncbi:putative tail fiber protein [Pseudomonas phage PSV6]|nr:putative tail fiber protein [Pseudomonas phage PSV6]
MATAPKTTVTYNLNGTDRDFQIPFEYLVRKFVQVTLVGVDRKVLTLNIDYRFTQRTIITTTKGWGPADGYQLIEIRRYTSATERLVDFSDGSILRAYDLNTAQVQSLHIAEEGRDIATDTIGVNNDGDLDARGRKIVNVADGTSDFDAVNLRQQRLWAGSAMNQADRAKSEADRATTQADRATAQAQASANSAATSKAQADESLKWAGESYTHRQASAASAAASLKSAQDVAGSNSAAAAQAAEATRQAGLATSNGAAQVSLATTQANRAKDEADRATAQANLATTNGATQVSLAKAQADRATSEADRAKSEADKLSDMNGLANAIESTTGNTVKFKDGWAISAQGVTTNNFWSRNGASFEFDKGMIVRGNIDVLGNIDANNLTSKVGSLNLKPASAGANTHVWFRMPDGVTENALIYVDSGGTMHFRPRAQADYLTLSADGSVNMRNTLRISGGGAIITGRVTTDEVMSNGAIWAGGGQSWMATDGNIYGPVWGGYLSNRIAAKQNAHHFQAGRVGVGAPGGGYRQFRVNFHAPMGGPTVQITIFRPALHVAVGSRGEAWVDGIDENGFTCWVHCEAGATWDTYIDWMASPAVNVAGG